MIAVGCVMGGVWRFQDLVAWKLAFQLKEVADEISRKPAIAKDFKFHSQLTDAAAWDLVETLVFSGWPTISGN
mgnify:CR=1 FL=1